MCEPTWCTAMTTMDKPINTMVATTLSLVVIVQLRLARRVDYEIRLPGSLD
eukprot:m.111843 g.111843  ORF g.111843 m.111843 type:complete len:51 (+) comp28148_c1_seq3:575-727(+)